MSERNTDRREKEWADEIPIRDEEERVPEEYEKTYRDGSLQNECAPEE